MKVAKFGGTSVATAENIKKVTQIVSDQNGSNLIVVVSALGGCTDALLNALHLASEKDEGFRTVLGEIEARHLSTVKSLFKIDSQSHILSTLKSEFNTLETLLEGAFLIGEYTPKLSDRVVGYGELLSSYIISNYFKAEGLDAMFKDARELITTDENYGKAAVDFEVTHTNCTAFFPKVANKVVVVPGFVASTPTRQSTTLGRGGSDYTAAILANAVTANELQIWTDVSGMYTANPKLVKQAKAIPNISYEEAMELSHFGAKVLYPPTIQPVLDKGIPIHIKNTFAPGHAGTLITKDQQKTGNAVCGISHVGNIALLSLEGSGMVGISGISTRLFETLSDQEISVILITQASSEHSICVAIAEKDAVRAKKAINTTFAYEIAANKIDPVRVEDAMAIIALVGDQMRSHQGLSGKLFSTLGKNNVNIRAIAQGASERNISAAIAASDVKKALNTLHETFFEADTKQLNLFVMGVGNVGSKLLQQLKQQQAYLKEELQLNLRLVGLANSKKMMFDGEGIAIDGWQDQLAGGSACNLGDYVATMARMNLRNSVFIDNTASAQVAQLYVDCLKQSIAVVTCNKIACSSDFDTYHNLKRLSKKYTAPFLFETNVGAGLPIIDTLKHLIVSGDRVRKIQAVLSGSLNFVFNTFSSETTFHDVVQQAMEQGYTEPDPKIDLSGIDVMRKILILARESGHAMEIDSITNDSFLPEEALDAKDNIAFFEALKKYEDQFQDRYQNALTKGCKLKYVAQFEAGKAKVGLQEIQKGHDFYALEGSDNIVLFYTDRYPEQPLIIKGAGAGAAVTASGIFADIIRIGNF